MFLYKTKGVDDDTEFRDPIPVSRFPRTSAYELY